MSFGVYGDHASTGASSMTGITRAGQPLLLGRWNFRRAASGVLLRSKQSAYFASLVRLKSIWSGNLPALAPKPHPPRRHAHEKDDHPCRRPNNSMGLRITQYEQGRRFCQQATRNTPIRLQSPRSFHLRNGEILGAPDVRFSARAVKIRTKPAFAAR